MDIDGGMIGAGSSVKGVSRALWEYVDWEVWWDAFVSAEARWRRVWLPSRERCSREEDEARSIGVGSSNVTGGRGEPSGCDVEDEEILATLRGGGSSPSKLGGGEGGGGP